MLQGQFLLYGEDRVILVEVLKIIARKRSQMYKFLYICDRFRALQWMVVPTHVSVKDKRKESVTFQDMKRGIPNGIPLFSLGQPVQAYHIGVNGWETLSLSFTQPVRPVLSVVSSFSTGAPFFRFSFDRSIQKLDSSVVKPK